MRSNIASATISNDIASPVSLTFDPAGPVVLAGGAGVVGRALAPLVARLDGREVVIAARDADRARRVVERVTSSGGQARHLVWQRGGTLNTRASVVVGLLNDPSDVLLRQAVDAGVPFVDITRWTSRLQQTLGRLQWAPPTAPVVLASGWMGGLLPRVARALAQGYDVVRVVGSIRFSLADASGADSVEYMDRLWVPFDVPGSDGSGIIEPYGTQGFVTIDGARTWVGRFDTPEQWTLPLSAMLPSTTIPAVSVSIGFDNVWLSRATGLLVWLGVFRLLRSERFRSVRRGLLRETGAEQRAPARAAFRVDVVTRDAGVVSRTIHHAGQADLTAVGALLAIRQARRSAPGVWLPEHDVDDNLWNELVAAGVGTSEDPRDG